jgi:hypothetical protein
MSHAWIAHLYTMDRNLTPVETALTGSVPSEVSSGTDAWVTAFVTCWSSGEADHWKRQCVGWQMV